LQSSEHVPLSLHSNIPTLNAGQIKIRDQYTHRVVARVDRQWLRRDRLTLEGRSLQIAWYDGEALWVSTQPGGDTSEHLRYRSTRQVLPYDLACQIPVQLGLRAGAAPIVPYDEGWLCFHWLGDVYGRALIDLLGYTLPVQETTQPGLCLLFTQEPRSLPTWTEDDVRRYLRDHFHRYESMLALGAYHHLLPVAQRRYSVIEQFDVTRFVETVARLHYEPAPETLSEELRGLLL
jgi:hypothetical protein